MIVSVQFSSVAQLCPTLWYPMDSSTLGLPVHHQLPEFTQTHIHRVSDAIPHLILCHPLFLLPPIPPSIRVLSNESTLRMRWPKCWSFSFSIIPSKEHAGLISFRMDWLDLLAVQGTLKSLLQYHSSKASILLLAVNKTLWVQPCRFWQVVTEGEENWKTPQQSWGAKVLGMSCLDHEGETPCATSGKPSQPWSTSYIFQNGQDSCWQSRGWNTPDLGPQGVGWQLGCMERNPGGKKAGEARLTEGQVSSMGAGT